MVTDQAVLILAGQGWRHENFGIGQRKRCFAGVESGINLDFVEVFLVLVFLQNLVQVIQLESQLLIFDKGRIDLFASKSFHRIAFAQARLVLAVKIDRQRHQHGDDYQHPSERGCVHY